MEEKGAHMMRLAAIMKESAERLEGIGHYSATIQEMSGRPKGNCRGCC